MDDITTIKFVSFFVVGIGSVVFLLGLAAYIYY